MSEKNEQINIELPGRLPREKRKRSDSILPDETETMERKRRLVEQQGHRKLTKVHARDHAEREQQTSGDQLQRGPLEHPYLADRQDLDGTPPNLSSLPPENPEARRDFDNERREQEKEKQLRLGNMPKFSTAPRPER